MTNCGSRTVSGFNHILEDMFQYYVKSIMSVCKVLVHLLRSQVFSHVVASLCDISGPVNMVSTFLDLHEGHLKVSQ